MKDAEFKQPTYPTDQQTQAFINALLCQPVRLPGAPTKTDPLDGEAVRVQTVQTDYPGNTCWFNCVDYSVKHATRVVFGWAIWRLAAATFVAQHHAVVRGEEGLRDVTLHGTFDWILFVPDARAPFDFTRKRYPFNFERSGDRDIWYAREQESLRFAVAVMQEDAVTDDMREVIAVGTAAGVI